jgi:hypothetical protein
MPSYATQQMQQQRRGARGQAAQVQSASVADLNRVLSGQPKAILKKVTKYAAQNAQAAQPSGFQAFWKTIRAFAVEHKYEVSTVGMVALYMLYEHLTKVTLANSPPDSFSWEQTLGIPKTSALASGGSVVDQVFAEAERCEESARVRARQ